MCECVSVNAAAAAKVAVSPAASEYVFVYISQHSGKNNKSSKHDI